MNKKTFIILFFICCLSLFINLYKKNSSPPCFNTDEASFGYNAYSILKTGRDEYGTLLPLRLKSFGDYKMPLYSYLSIPFIVIGGLNEVSTKALNSTIAFLFPIIIFLLSKQLFGKNNIGYLAAFLFSLTPAIQAIGRQAHEAYLTTFFITLSLWLLLKSLSRSHNLYKALFLISLIPLSFGYQFSRLWLIIFFVITIYFMLRKKLNLKFLFIFLIFLGILSIPDFIINPARVKNLLFFNNIGLGLQTAELRSEGGTRLIYNKATVGLKNLIFNHLSYYSPEFLVIKGDENKRFNYEGISPITLIEYLFIFVGLYYLFKNKEKDRYILILCLLVSPLPSSLAWAGNSITRCLPLIIFLNLISAYGFFYLINGQLNKTISKIILILFLITYLIFNFYSWNFYFNHYPKRSQTIRSWNCGNKEMANYIKNNYANFDHFYITRKNSQPYIFLLFYLPVNPSSYQKQAFLSAPDEFGFGQIVKFDKFNFNFQYNPQNKKTVSIGYPEDFNNQNLNKDQLKKIKIGTEEMFWIYEQN